MISLTNKELSSIPFASSTPNSFILDKVQKVESLVPLNVWHKDTICSIWWDWFHPTKYMFLKTEIIGFFILFFFWYTVHQQSFFATCTFQGRLCKFVYTWSKLHNFFSLWTCCNFNILVFLYHEPDTKKLLLVGSNIRQLVIYVEIVRLLRQRNRNLFFRACCTKWSKHVSSLIHVKCTCMYIFFRYKSCKMKCFLPNNNKNYMFYLKMRKAILQMYKLPIMWTTLYYMYGGLGLP